MGCRCPSCCYYSLVISCSEVVRIRLNLRLEILFSKKHSVELTTNAKGQGQTSIMIFECWNVPMQAIRF